MAWARQVIDLAAQAMREECVHSGRQDMWDVFDARVLAPALHGAPPVPYDQLVQRFGYRTPDQASNVLITAKRTFQRALREVVAQYADDDQIDDEIRELKVLVSCGT